MASILVCLKLASIYYCPSAINGMKKIISEIRRVHVLVKKMIGPFAVLQSMNFNAVFTKRLSNNL